ncbi:hypothetical protein N8083_01960 [Candidatus Pacebacteria bacterium]|nr:hypothetical protein [Candidatus Paceibacterota bacterium]
MITIRATLCICFVFSLLLTATHYVHAQSSFNVTNLNIIASPAYPEPFAEVELKLDAYSINTTGSTISWFIDGVEQIDARNTRKMNLIVGDLGETVAIRVELKPLQGAAITIKHKITPARVDIVVEADTLVPLHYKGRALPSNGSIVRAIALPATGVDPATLTYKWSVNNSPLYGGSLVGRNVALFKAPLKDEMLLSVEVGNRDGTVLTSKTTHIEIPEAELHFYEDNPLRGLSRNAIRSPHTLVGDEITVRAEPYFMSKDIFALSPHIEWKIDNETIANPSENPQTITLRGDGGNGRFTVDFHIRNLANILQGVQDDFIIAF